MSKALDCAAERAEGIRAALRCDRPGCPCMKPGPSGMTHCPVHEDDRPSMSVTQRNGRVLLKCFAGCPQDAVLEALRARNLWHEPGERTGVTLAELAAAKRLPPEFLRTFGVHDVKLRTGRAVCIPYYGTDGEESALRYRIALHGDRFRWKEGSRVLPYGLWLLRAWRERHRYVLLVEGESDAWTCWYRGVPALGLPGKTTWRAEWARYLDGFEVLIWQEPGAEDLVARIAHDIPQARVLVAPDGVKDISEAHVRGEDVRSLVERLAGQARTAGEIAQEAADAEVMRLREMARPVLEHPDPLERVRDAIREMGYAGDPQPVLVAYLAATTRLLKLRRGQMPAHLLAVGAPSLGKSYALQTALALLPPEAYHVIDAGSPRVLIYDTTDLQHRVVCFSEIDSLPRGEDNPAASAVRNLLQDHALNYKVVIRNPDTGDFTVRMVSRPGPTVLVSSAVRGVGGQLGTRLFILPVPDDAERVRRVLEGQAELELEPPADPPGELLAFQSYLQRLGPWDVVVPFAPVLARLINRGPVSPRLTRDFARLLSLIKAVTILRHRHRRRDERGRLMADPDDYAALYPLIRELYEATVTGASEVIRRVVDAVRQAREEGMERVSYAEVAQRTGLHHQQVRRAVDVAVRQGWLENLAPGRKGASADLRPGEPLPDRVGLPTPQELAREMGEISTGEPCAGVQVGGNLDGEPIRPAQEGVQAGARGVQAAVPGPSLAAQGPHQPAQEGVQVKAASDGPSSQPAHLHTGYRGISPTPPPPGDGQADPASSAGEEGAPDIPPDPEAGPPPWEDPDLEPEDQGAEPYEAVERAALQDEATPAPGPGEEPPEWAMDLARALPGGDRVNPRALAARVADLAPAPAYQVYGGGWEARVEEDEETRRARRRTRGLCEGCGAPVAVLGGRPTCSRCGWPRNRPSEGRP